MSYSSSDLEHERISGRNGAIEEVLLILQDPPRGEKGRIDIKELEKRVSALKNPYPPSPTDYD